jgi:general secretion pathway protein K
MHPIKIRGGALLTALFIMTLIAIVATAMSARLQLDIYRTRLIISQDKLLLATQAVTFWAMEQLEDKNNHFTQSNKQGMVSRFPKDMEYLGAPIQISGELYDLQALFNLNNLIEKKMLSVFINLLSHTVPQINNTERLNVTLAIQDWLKPYDLAQGKDEYTSYYLAQNPPYYPSHQLMSSATELRLIKNLNSSAYQAIIPYVIALPETTAININSAPKKVLMSLGNGLSDQQADELIKARGEKGIKNLQEINELTKKINLPTEQITIDSQYFLNVAHASQDEFKVTIYTVMKRSLDKQGKVTVSIISESINSFN